MKTADLSLRCYAQREPDNSWYAICIDLNLFCQGDSRLEVTNKLNEMINDYVTDAFTTDQGYFSDLIPRKAPLSFRFRYYFLWLKTKFLHIKDCSFYFYDDHLPLFPKKLMEFGFENYKLPTINSYNTNYKKYI